LTTILEESKRERVGRKISLRDPLDFGRKAWMQSDKSKSAWVTVCPKEHNGLNPRLFPVVVQTYFGVRQRCLKGMEGLYIRQKSGRKEEGSGDKMRRVREKSGEGDITGSRMDATTWRYEHSISPDSATVTNGQHNGGRGPRHA